MHDVRGLIALQALDRYGTIVQAAKSLGFTPSAVSQQLTGLERELGIALVDRGPRSAVLNAAGREYLDAASGVLPLLNAARARAAAAVGQLSGQFVVATIPSLASRVATVLANLRRAEPLLSITLMQSSAPHAQQGLVDGAVDIAVVDDWATRTAVPDSRVAAALCYVEPVVLAGHPQLLDGRGKDWSTVLRSCLADVPLLSATAGSYSREFTDAWIAGQGISPRLRWEFDGLDTLAELVAQGHGVSFLPRSVLRKPTTENAFALPAPSSRAIRCQWLRTPGPADAAVRRCVETLSTSICSPADEL